MAGLFAGWIVVPNVRRFLLGNRGAGLDDAAPRDAQEANARALDRILIPVAQLTILLAWRGLTGHWWTYVLLWALPLVMVGSALNALRATIEHADTHRPPNLLLSFVSNPIERFFVGPLNFNYHYEHHRFMTVPYYRMAEVRRRLLAAGDYDEGELLRTYVGRLRSLLRNLRTGEPA